MIINFTNGPKDGQKFQINTVDGEEAAELISSIFDGVWFSDYDKHSREIESRYYFSYREDGELFFIYDGHVINTDT